MTLRLAGSLQEPAHLFANITRHVDVLTFGRFLDMSGSNDQNLWMALGEVT